jgi:RND family efflux transporter MFP subunit
MTMTPDTPTPLAPAHARPVRQQQQGRPPRQARAGRPRFALRRGVARLARVTLASLVALALLPAAQAAPPAAAAPAPAKAALTVSVVSPSPASVPGLLQANGNVAAWQEAVIGSEANGLRLAEVKVEVGERVKRGQILAVFATDTLKAELVQIQAGLAEAESVLGEAAGNAERARALRDSGVMTLQQVQQALTAEQTARARVSAQRAALDLQQLRLAQALVLAPDDGLISTRSATVGSVLGAGQELFRLIRAARLEWRAEVPASELARIRIGQRVTLTTPGGRSVAGTVRQIAPTVDAATRNGIVYVDLRAGADSAEVRAGMFCRGEFSFEAKSALTLPASAVLLRDGFQVVMLVGADARVSQVKVKVLSRDGERVALEGLPASARVVARGAAFLSDGDTVKVVAP